MSDVTQILSRIDAGDPRAAEELLPLVYDELRKLAAARMKNERPDHTLQATALVHEAYLRLVDAPQSWESRGHFFAAAANSMRQILVSSARAKKSLKRGGANEQVDLEALPAASQLDPEMILDLDQSLDSLAEEDAQAAELVKLRLFAGLSVSDAGQALSLSRTAAYECWQYARVWFAERDFAANEK